MVRTTIHFQPHPYAGKTMRLAAGVTDPVRQMVLAGVEFTVEDWWDRVNRDGSSWANGSGDPVAFQYGLRILNIGHIPLDDEVVYGKIGTVDHLVHTSEIAPGAPA